MANSDKNIVITPNISNTSEPKIVFTGGNNNPTTMRVLDDGTISFEGGAGQLFSISNTATGQIFAVNDISGYPLSEVYSNGFISLARSYGKVSIGSNATPGSSMVTITGNSTTTGLNLLSTVTPQNLGYLRTPSNTFFAYNATGEMVLMNLSQLRFTDGTAWSYDSWGGIKYTTANSTLMIGGPGAPGFSNNGVVSANLVMHNATTGNFLVANSSATNLFVGANGNVGIACTTPTWSLHAGSSARIEGTVSVGGSGTFSIDAPNISNGRLIVTADPTGNGTNGSPNANVGIGVAAPVYKLQVNGAVGFVNSSATQTLFASNGNIGIGNTTPAHKLRIEAGSLSLGNTTSSITISIPTSVQASATNYVLNANGSWTIPTAAAVAGGANTQIQYNDSGSAAGSAAFTFNNTTNAVSLSGKLSVGDRLYGAANLTNAFWMGTLAGGEPNGLGFGMFANSTGGIDNVQTMTSGIRRISVLATGNVGISNTTPDATLAVTGTANVSANVWIGGSAIIAGNLTVSGTTTYINTTTLNIGDNIITLNADLGAVAPTENAGIEVNRGTSSNVSFIWNESGARWEASSGNSAINELRLVSNTYTRTVRVNGGGVTDSWGSVATIDEFATFSVASGVNRFRTNSRDYYISNTASDFLMVSSANGNVGIGNSTPGSVLVVERSDNTFATAVTVRNPNTGGQAQAILELVSDDGGFRLFKASAAGGGMAGVYVSTADPLVLYTNTVSRVYITATGNVGISNTAPDATLAVTGTANVSGNVVIGGQLSVGANVIANTTALFVGNSTVNTVITQTTAAFNTNSTATALTMLANGNIGIGGNPNYIRLWVTGPQDPYVYFNAANGNMNFETNVANVNFSSSRLLRIAGVQRAWETVSDSSYSLNSYGTDNNAILFRPNGTTMLRVASLGITGPNNFFISANGNVGIGNTTPADKLVIAGNLRLTEYTETAYVADSSTAITLALTNGTVQIITLTATTTITMPTAVAGKSFVLYLKQDATGSRTVTWTTVKWPGGTAPTITSTASKQDIYSFFSDGTNWYGATVGQNYTP